ncbi:unnamed protein product [Toxocara canis]|uniref:Uncharacterized protein n=1 Tax=Toxocara canis TaxID=6265 RepID=A0A183UBK6_TOXCA|nr:unnamed protein product [Toxocara canis]
MNDVADQYKETEDRKAELRIFKVKEAPNYDTDARENARIARIEGSPELEERSSVREIAQHFGALHEPLFAAKVRTFADDESTRVASSIKVSSLQLRPELHQTNVSGTDSASSPSGVKCAEQFSDHGGDHLSLNKAILSSPTTIDISPKAVGTVDASADHSQLPTSIETQISQPTAASNGHAVEGDTRRSPERIASQAITNPSVAADKKSGSSGDEGGELPQAKINTTSNVSVTDGHDLCNDEYNQVVQFATHSNVSKLLYNITNISTTTAASNGHQTTKPDVDACKESVSSAGLTETSDSCALVGSAQTDVESNADNTRDDNPEKKMASDEVVAQKVIATDASAAHPSRSGQVAQEAPRVQTVVMKKKRSNECFADAKVDGSHSKRSSGIKKGAIGDFIKGLIAGEKVLLLGLLHVTEAATSLFVVRRTLI